MRLGTCWISIYGDLEFSKIYLAKKPTFKNYATKEKDLGMYKKLEIYITSWKQKIFLLTNACGDFSINEPTPNMLLYLPEAKH